MFIKFSEEAQKVLKNAKKEMQKLKHAFVGSEHVILSILKMDNFYKEKLLEYNITYELFQKELIKLIGMGKAVNNYFIYTPLLKRVLEQSIIDAKESNANEVTVEHILMSILDEGEGVGIRVLTNLGVNIDELYEEMNKKTYNKKTSKKLLINEIGVDLNKKALENEIDPLIGRDAEVQEIIEILLRKNKNNPLLIGEAGVGKTAIVENLAQKINEGMVPERLKKYHIYSLSMAKVVSGTKYRGEFEERVTKILKEIENSSNVIVFIDEIHTIVGAGGAEGAIDASNILKPVLARGKIKLIGATTIKEYQESIAKDKALNRRFQVVKVKENTLNETKNILYQLKPIYEKYHQVLIPNDIIDLIVKLSDKYIQDKKNPDKSIDILDTVCAKVSLSENKKSIKLNNLKNELLLLKKKKRDLIMHQEFEMASQIRQNEMKVESKINNIVINSQKEYKIVTIKDISKVIESKSGIPLYEINKDKKILLNLDKKLKSKVIGQDKIINELCSITRKIMLGLKNNLPTSLLFVGGSGVGKTMLVKEYCKILKLPLIRLDMSEYKEATAINKIIGSPPGYVGYSDMNTVLDQIRNKPYSLILLDEIEKCCSEVMNLFLQALDEGEMTTSYGEKVSLANTIIIMTSNIGSNNDNLGFNNYNEEKKIINELSIPLVNRLTKVMFFQKLSEETIIKIIQKKILELKKYYQDYKIKIRVSRKIIDKIIQDSKYEIYGARRLNKLIEEIVDEQIIQALLLDKNNVLI